MICEKSFKRLVSLVLCLALCLTGITGLAEETPVDGEAETTTQMLDSLLYSENRFSNDFYGVAMLLDQLYAYGYSGNLSAYDDTTKTWNALTVNGDKPADTTILRGDDALYALERETGALYALNVTGGEYTLTKKADLEWEGMRRQEGEYSYTAEIACGFKLEGTLYLLAADEDYNYAIYAFDLSTGKTSVIKLPGDAQLREFMPYQGQFAALTYDRLYLFSPETGAMEQLAEITNGSGLAQDKNGHLYLRAGDEIWSNRDGAFAVVGYNETGADNYGPLGAVLYQDKYYVSVRGSEVVMRDISPESKPAFSIKISGSMPDLTEALKAFAKEYPNVPVVRNESSYFSNAQELTEHMRGTAPADIYVLDPGTIKLATLARKEFAAPLDLPGYAEKLADKYRDALTYRGQLYAVAINAYAYSFGVSVKALKKVGLSEDDVPKTYADMMDFIDNWQSGLAQEYPEMQLFDGMQYTDMKSELLSGILHAHELNCQKRGEDALFNDPELQRLLEKLAKTDFYGFYDPKGTNSSGGMISFSMGDDTPSAIFTTYVSAMPEQWDNRYALMPLTVSETDGAIIGLSMMIAIMNPDTAHAAEVSALLRCMAENAEASTKIALMPDENTPVESPYMAQAIKEQEARIEQVKKLAEDEKDEEKKAEIQAYLDEMVKSLADYEKYRYNVSQQNIDDFRARDEYIVPDLGTVLYASNEITALNNRFRDDSISAREYLGELNRKVQMMLLEGD